MRDKLVYEYAVIRFVPRVEREEFINVGVILLCKRLDHLAMRVQLDEDRLRFLSPDVDLDELQGHLHTWDLICQGHPDGGPVALLDPANRFRWLTAPKSTMLQCSKVHPGLCQETRHVLDDLFRKYVL